MQGGQGDLRCGISMPKSSFHGLGVPAHRHLHPRLHPQKDQTDCGYLVKENTFRLAVKKIAKLHIP